jgi:protein-disulfide isomerase
MSAVKEDGLNGDLFKRCLADKQKVMPLIGDGLSAAQSLGAEETPYLLVGGEPVKGLVDETALRLVLDKQLNKK